MITASLALRHRLHLLHLDTRRNTLSGQLRRLLNTHEGRTRVRIRAPRCEINFWFVVVGSMSTRKAILCAEQLFIRLLNRQQKEKEEGRRSARLVSIIQLHFTFAWVLSPKSSCAKSGKCDVTWVGVSWGGRVFGNEISGCGVGKKVALHLYSRQTALKIIYSWFSSS